MDKEGGYTKDIVRIEFEWKPPRCDHCKIFGHTDSSCTLNKPITKPHVNNHEEDGFEEVKRKKRKNKNNGFHLNKKPQVVYRPKVVTQEPEPTNIYETLDKVDDDGNLKDQHKGNTEDQQKGVGEHEVLGDKNKDKGEGDINLDEKNKKQDKAEGASTPDVNGLNV